MAKRPEAGLRLRDLAAGRPNPPALHLDRKKLALIHIVKKELKIPDEDYRCLLRRIAGVESSKDLDEARFRKLMYFFVRSDYYRVNSFGLTLRQKLFIKALARELRWDKNHLVNFVRKYYRREGLDFLTRKEASNLIESLKAIRSHESRAE
jgi:hypothetical protein